MVTLERELDNTYDELAVGLADAKVEGFNEQILDFISNDIVSYFHFSSKYYSCSRCTYHSGHFGVEVVLY